MTDILLVVCLVLLLLVLIITVLVYKRIQRAQHGIVGQLERWVVSSLSSIETRLRYQASIDKPGNTDVVVVVSRERASLLERCLRSVHQSEGGAHIIAVDVGSTDHTASILDQLRREGIVATVIAHAPHSVAQWQKGYGIHETWRVASLLQPRSLTVIDDDMLVQEPFLDTCAGICALEQISAVALHRDAVQERNHPVAETIEYHGADIELGKTFNGAAFYLPWKTLYAWGPPPYNEGKAESGVEDWYYSRALSSEQGYVAFIPRVVEQDGVVSLRDSSMPG